MGGNLSGASLPFLWHKIRVLRYFPLRIKNTFGSATTWREISRRCAGNWNQPPAPSHSSGYYAMTRVSAVISTPINRPLFPNATPATSSR